LFFVKNQLTIIIFSLQKIWIDENFKQNYNIRVVKIEKKYVSLPMEKCNAKFQTINLK